MAVDGGDDAANAEPDTLSAMLRSLVGSSLSAQ